MIKRLRFLLLLTGCLFILPLAAQECSYRIRNFYPKEYGGHNQVWQVTQDKNGLLYFASTSRIHVYDGVRWSIIQVRDGSAVRQVTLDSLTQTIYVGGVGTFGYLQRQSDGRLSYVAISDSIKDKSKTFSDVWKVFVIGDKVYFQTFEYVFVVKDKKIIQTIAAEDPNLIPYSFSVNGKMYVRQRNVGLEEVRDGKLVLVPGGDQFKSTPLLGIVPSATPGINWVFSYDKGVWTMRDKPDASGSLFSAQPVYTDSFLLSAGVLGARWVNDSSLAINTRLGLAFYDRNLKQKEFLDQTTGLSDATIAEVFVDRERNIWLVHNNGISCISYNSNTRYYTSNGAGFSGSMEMMYRFHNKLYLATTEGIFFSAPPDSIGRLRFQPLDMPRTEVWSLDEFNGELLASSSNGLLRINGDKAEKITDNYTNCIRETPVKGELITIEKEGITLVRITPGGKTQEVLHAAVPSRELIAASKVLTSKNNKNGQYEFWCYSRFRYPIYMKLDTVSGKLDMDVYDTTCGLPSQSNLYIVAIGDSTYFCDSRHAYRFRPSAGHGPGIKSFSAAPDILKRLTEGPLDGVELFGNYRLFFDKNRGDTYTVYFGKDAAGKLRAQHATLTCMIGQEAQFIFADQTGATWTLSHDQLFQINTRIKDNSDKKYTALIRNMSIVKNAVLKKDSLLLFNNDRPVVDAPMILPYAFNSVRFNFAAPFFDREEVTQFTFKLDGYDSNWSDTTLISEKEYQNLPEGTYTFRVRALNIYMSRSSEGSVTFTILPPWYRTGWAYLLYFIGFVAVVYLSIRISIRRLRKAKQRLEKIVSQRTEQVVQQKQQLETAFKDIRDSITYAKRIQEAILPDQQNMHALLPGMFVLFRPRDIVSGDFYWFVRRDKKSFVASVDCTGHGVPGAFMSMIGNTLLNEIVLEKKIESPDEVLDMLHLRVRQALKQDSGGETRDGMDVALVVIDHEKQTLEYAGANRPLWMISGNKFTEIKPDKMPIGGHAFGAEDASATTRKFTKHTIALRSGDSVYLSTDGYADQFGGENGKKFMAKRLHQLLLDIHSLPPAAQQERLDQAFLEWKGEHEQVDDVLVIGIRYT